MPNWSRLILGASLTCARILFASPPVSFRARRVYNNTGGCHEPTYILVGRRSDLWADRYRPCAPNCFGVVDCGSRLLFPDVGKWARCCRYGLSFLRRISAGEEVLVRGVS